MNHPDPQISFDQPLKVGSALDQDALSRCSFAKAAAAALGRVSVSSGFVVSIEGTWGSGKTSVLAMIEELLKHEDNAKRPLVVHFNPWLIGDRDSLLRHFLSRMASAIELSDHAHDGKKVSLELKAYSKAFDFVKFIPGAEPWASLVKSLIESAGAAAGAIADHKAPDLEQNKQRLEEALKNFPRPIIVFIDDIDRLFPPEVFEIIRIIKAVGGLSHVGYVVAWDPTYVSGALAALGVPQSETYLDKIVQVRMPLPSLSMPARARLINDALDTLDPEAAKPRFKDDETRLSHLYFSGLRELLEQPRDVTRVFNTLRVIEPALRGEVIFSDIVGLASLMVKATPVFDLLRKDPACFVGKQPGGALSPDKAKAPIKEGARLREKAYHACSSPAQVRRVVHFLFPMVAEEEGSFASSHVSDVEGHLAHPTRLLIALQLSISPSDVSIESARRYLQQPERREGIARSLTADNCLEFLEFLGDVAESLEGEGIADLEALCLSIASLADKEPFPSRHRNRKDVFVLRSEHVAVRAINLLVDTADSTKKAAIAQKTAESENALTVAARVVMDSYVLASQGKLVAPKATRANVLQSFSKNVLQASSSERFFSLANPSYILWALARAMPESARDVYEALRSSDPTLDNFATHFLHHGFDSKKGQIFSLPNDIQLLTAFSPLDEFKAHAADRLADENLVFPARSAWMAVTQGEKIYAIDGSPED